MKIFAYLIICIVTSFFGLVLSDNENAIYQNFTKLVNAVYKVIGYYEKEYMNMNIDGIFGLRVLEGELFSLIYSQNSNHRMYGKMFEKQWKIVQKTLSEASLSLQSKNKEQFDELGYLVKVAWLPIHSYYSLSHKLVWPKYKQKSYTDEIVTEAISDHCITELVTRKDDQRCNLSEQCVKTMLLSDGLYGYQLTHQVLYISLVQRMYCQYQVKSVLSFLNISQDIFFIKHVFCVNMFQEVNETIYKFNYDIPDQFQDLLLEQIFTCGGSGYLQFADMHLLDKILLWQDQNKGCFMDSGQSVQRRRRLFEEIELKDGCLAHKTSVALAALTVYLHLFVRSEHVDFSGLPDYASIIRKEIFSSQRRLLPSLLADSPSRGLGQYFMVEKSHKVVVNLEDVYLPKSLGVNDNILWNSVVFEEKKSEEEESGGAAAILSLKLIFVGLFFSLVLLLLNYCKARQQLRTFLSHCSR